MATKVLFLIDSLSPVGGKEILAVELALLLKRSGNYEPIVYSTREGGALEKGLKSGKVEYYVLNRKSKLGFYKFLRIVNFIRKEKIKIIHSHNLGSNFWGALIGRICNIPIIIAHKHGHDYNNWLSVILQRIVNVFSNQIIFVSDYEKNQFLKIFDFPVEKCKTIYNGIRISNQKKVRKEVLTKNFGLSRDDRIVCIVARFSEEKNHKTFILAAREVINKLGNVKFLLVGDGPTKKQMEELSENLSISDKMIFTGYMNELSDTLQNIDIGCLSSSREGLGIVLLEYMAFKKPIVSTNVGGISEVVQEGVNGYLVPAGDHNTMAEKIITLLKNEQLQKKMGNEGYLIFRKNFTEKIMLNKVENLYKKLLDTL